MSSSDEASSNKNNTNDVPSSSDNTDDGKSPNNDKCYGFECNVNLHSFFTCDFFSIKINAVILN